MLNHNQRAKGVADYLAKYNNYPVADYIGYPTPGSLGSFVNEFLDCGIITYELPTISETLNMDEIWLENSIALQSYFSHSG